MQKGMIWKDIKVPKIKEKVKNQTWKQNLCLESSLEPFMREIPGKEQQVAAAKYS